MASGTHRVTNEGRRSQPALGVYAWVRSSILIRASLLPVARPEPRDSCATLHFSPRFSDLVFGPKQPLLIKLYESGPEQKATEISIVHSSL